MQLAGIPQWALDCCQKFGVFVKAKTVSPLKFNRDEKLDCAAVQSIRWLSSAKYTRLTGASPRTWRDAVADYIGALIQENEKPTSLLFTLSIMICVTARAELKWDQTSIELHPTTADKQAIGHFKYQNSGSKPVRFKSVRTSCGCTAAQSQKEEVPPGEKGEITATFNIGERTGTQVKNCNGGKPTTPSMPPRCLP